MDERILALAKLLEMDMTDEESLEDVIVEVSDNLFEVSPHTVKDGLSPKEALRRVEQLRTALSIIGYDSTNWTTDTFLREWREHELTQKEIKGNKKAINDLKDSLPTIVPPMSVCEKCGKAFDMCLGTKCRCGGTILRNGQKRKLISADLPFCQASLRDKVSSKIKRIEQLQKQLALLQCVTSEKLIYRSICKKIEDNPQTAEMLKIGVHEIVNTLYALVPEADSIGPEDWKWTIREAFNTGNPVDRRTTRETNDGEFLVLTDDEADERWEEELDNYLNDGCVEGADSKYFDRDAWKTDARGDGRGHALSIYDGDERESEGFYIYRVN